MAHQHDHHGHHKNVNYNRSFAIGAVLNILFVVIEAGYGFYADSLALLSDAGHNLSDVLSLLLAWGAFWMASLKPTPRRTYGFGRVTILASLFSAFMLLAALGAMAWEAVGRFSVPHPVSGMTMIVVAGIGVVVNGVTAFLFLSGKDEDLNIKGAYLHMAADTGVSLGVVIAGLAIMYTGWNWLDPAISLLIVVIIFIGTWDLLRESLNLSLDTVPRDIDPHEVERYLTELEGVDSIHDLHIWPLSTTRRALTVHLVVREGVDGDRLLGDISETLEHEFGIGHATVQIEGSVRISSVIRGGAAVRFPIRANPPIFATLTAFHPRRP